jgi:NTE family protein
VLSQKETDMPDEQTHEPPADVAPEAPLPPEARPGVPPESPRPDDKRHGIALCLSGGGFRAALFHLGSLRRLHEVGALQQVRTISCVSGGSILGGYLAGVMIDRGMSGLEFKDWEKDVAAGFRQFAGRDLRTWPMVMHLPWNWAAPGLRVNHLVRRYESRLTSRKLGELPQTPNFIFCATDLTFGVNWTFCRGRSGDYQAGYTKVTDDWPIARAVAASACFPPLFGPMPLALAPQDLKGGRYKGDERDDLVRRIGLSDGGVYDNMAMEPAWKTHECVLVSDCGAPFGHQAGGHYFKRLMRYTGVVMNQAAAVRKRAFFADISEKDPRRPRRYRGGY